MIKQAVGIIGISLILGGAAHAADETSKERLKNELTAGIPAAGVHAMHEIRQSLAARLPAGLPLKQQLEQLRAAYGGKSRSDQI